jgi:hypothetical protein
MPFFPKEASMRKFAITIIVACLLSVSFPLTAQTSLLGVWAIAKGSMEPLAEKDSVSTLYIGPAISLDWAVADGPYLYGQTGIILRGTPIYDIDASLGAFASAGICLPFFSESGIIGPDFSGTVRFVSWTDQIEYTHNGPWGASLNYNHTGTYLDAQARIGVRIMPIFHDPDADAYFRFALTAHAIYGYGNAVDVTGPTSSAVRTSKTIINGDSFGFVGGIEFAGFLNNFRLCLGYYRGLLFGITWGFGWIF